MGCALWGQLNNPILGLYATQKWPHMPTIVKSDPWYRLPWIKARTRYGSFFHRLPPMHGFHQWPIYVPWPQSPPLFQSIYRVQGWDCIHSKVTNPFSRNPFIRSSFCKFTTARCLNIEWSRRMQLMKVTCGCLRGGCLSISPQLNIRGQSRYILWGSSSRENVMGLFTGFHPPS